ncbi:E2/UBC family protein [Phenylobacterium soli]|uniref:Uncharacterized protein n=1 Tax=Phenylobacterium soli TaxID=2170551 RepID=A0A328AAW8_9CAUL|nr:E2/UBC family protein [Phenylobacterium soli]RAK51760.1 hypothetical protein DJ017_18190 [Phenylobacterium soli]
MFEAQLQALVARYPGTSATPLSGGGHLVTVPDVVTGAGWSKPRVTVRFVAPQGFPYANPDSFWVDEDLRLAGGGHPQNVQFTPMPDGAATLMWFSWHLCQPWDPNRDTLLTWMAVVGERFRAAR